ncbi:MAG: hypothetical protein QOG63_1096 [Thermoleophilaceae bacterium]|nr:hypothetical protein [Thermoleophilaceae bacterium]
MRELDRTAAAQTTVPTPLEVASIALVGRGRVGRTLATALRAAGYRAADPCGRGEPPSGADAILLCVPDAEIPAAAAAVAGAAPYVGHTSGATPLSALEPAGGEAFGLHPLQTIPAGGADLRGCGAGVAGSTPAALELARAMATRLGMVPFELRDSQRAAYHAAASIASNFLVTLEWAAQSVAARAGVDAPFGPLARTAVENWIAAGPHAALTGPIARGDEATVAAQREAVAGAAPEFVAMFDALAERTRALAAEARA